VLVHGSDRHPNLGPGIASDLSPDGNSALVAEEIRQTTGVSQITRLWAENIWTHETRVLAEAAPEEDLGPISRWSPDGGRVAFRLTVWDVDPSKQHPGPTPRIETVCIVDVGSLARRCFSDLGRVYSFDWSPDGSKLVVGGPGHEGVQIVDTATGVVSVVLPPSGGSSVREALAAAGHGRPVQFVDPIWSPSGRYLAAMASMVGGDAAYVPVMFTANGEFVAMGLSSTEFMTEAWSSVADVLAYTRAKAPYTTTGVFLLDAKTRQSRLLLDTGRPRAEVTTLAWSPSGRWLAANELLSGTIVILDVDRGSPPAEVDQGKDIVAWAR
jgi:WD40 repeat protein